MYDQLKKTTSILYWALFVSRFIFAYILFEFIGPESLPSENRMLVHIAIGLAAILALGSYLLFTKSYSRSFLESAFLRSANGNQDLVPAQAKNWSADDLEQWKLMTRFQTASILAWALSDFIAVLGLIIPILGGSIAEGMYLIAASVLLGLFQKPNFNRFKTAVMKTN